MRVLRSSMECQGFPTIIIKNSFFSYYITNCYLQTLSWTSVRQLMKAFLFLQRPQLTRSKIGNLVASW